MAEGERHTAHDTVSAFFAAEEAMCDRIVLAQGIVPPASHSANAFGRSVSVDAGAGPLVLTRAIEHAGEGARVGVVAHAGSLLASPSAFGVACARGLPIVAHAVADTCEASALSDFGWGVLASSGAKDAIDLALVARRAAEDSRTPFLVLHDRSHLDSEDASGHTEPIADLVTRFVGPATPDPGEASPDHHAFASRVPFALGSAFRDYEKQGRRALDELVAGSPAPIALVGTGALATSLDREAARLLARGDAAFTLKITAIRPFPGPRVVKVLARTHLVIVVECASSPLAQSHFLAREIKAAFADALTWAPGYPGIGKIPRIVSLVTESGIISPDAVDALLASARAGRP